MRMSPRATDEPLDDRAPSAEPAADAVSGGEVPAAAAVPTGEVPAAAGEVPANPAPAGEAADPAAAAASGARSPMRRGLSAGSATARRMVTGPNKPALVVSLLVSLFAALFVTSYSLAMGNPQPHDIPLAVVSESITPEQLGDGLERLTGTTFQVESLPTQQAAEEALRSQRIYGALVSGQGDDATLLISSASGASIANVIKSGAPAVGQTFGLTIEVTDVNPLRPNDPSGLVLFYLALAATIIGFVGAIQTRVNASGMTIGGELGWDAGRAALVGLVIALTTGPVFGFETFPLVPVWGVLALQVFVAGAVYNFWRVVVGGKWALMPTWILFILISNPSSGGAVAPQLLPPFYEFMGRWMPTGATVRALRDLAYFPGAVHLEPYLVLGGWLVVATAAFVIARRVRYGFGRVEKG
jgi:hypothetical protein